MKALVESRSNEGDAAASSIDSAGQENQKQAKIDRDGGSPLGQSSDPHYSAPRRQPLTQRVWAANRYFSSEGIGSTGCDRCFRICAKKYSIFSRISSMDLFEEDNLRSVGSRKIAR